ncbi:acetyltransferase [Halolactibacillus alkaliphilus]|uniref:Acetyltransferase n=1 Tax=Halolactibacillus alkaliphilus TaxID=442899 RepID=A0A511X2E6_9BACI|nr:acetyltransferase [Halolactibacillus alkaliphilus]GEN57109.1 acetyltransferase [Halolactibacillus alkaliphilus]GGN72001.1 acetyltransferase [Halolactibacillus alkaliphilus]SFO86687.1 sugar O-acyltransferase, sialic acid O-acetyltransferase NeuD family [Halolactibacillus alkaliphilus]
MDKKILLIGGGGHCKSVLDSLLEINKYVEIGIVDKEETVGNSVMGVPVVGCDDDLPALFKDGYLYAFVTLGSIGNPMLRIKLFNLLSEIGYEIPVIIDNSAKVSTHAEIKQGVFIGKQSTINAGSLIQKGAIINSGSVVEHDCQIGAFSHIAPGAVLGGEVVVGEHSHIGSNATVKQQIHIGSNSIIGMGSVVLQNIDSNTIAYGNPCRGVKKQ